jgi:hypothetical protein
MDLFRVGDDPIGMGAHESCGGKGQQDNDQRKISVAGDAHTVQK